MECKNKKHAGTASSRGGSCQEKKVCMVYEYVCVCVVCVYLCLCVCVCLYTLYVSTSRNSMYSRKASFMYVTWHTFICYLVFAQPNSSYIHLLRLSINGPTIQRTLSLQLCLSCVCNWVVLCVSQHGGSKHFPQLNHLHCDSVVHLFYLKRKKPRYSYVFLRLQRMDKRWSVLSQTLNELDWFFQFNCDQLVDILCPNNLIVTRVRIGRNRGDKTEVANNKNKVLLVKHKEVVVAGVGDTRLPFGQVRREVCHFRHFLQGGGQKTVLNSSTVSHTLVFDESLQRMKKKIKTNATSFPLVTMLFLSIKQQ